MLQFQPPGFVQKAIATSLGTMAYYTTELDASSSFSSPSFPSSPSSFSSSPSSPPLVFLHSLGGGSSAYEWSKVYPAFAPDYPIIAPDLIGWGQSAHPARTYQVEDYLTMLSQLLEFVDRPAVVIASSLTAGLAIRLAIQRPALFRMLFLVSPAGYADFGADYGRNLAAQMAGIPGVDQMVYTLGAANEWAVRNFLEQFLFAEPSRLTPETVAAYLASARQFNAEYAALASLRGDLCFDLSLYLPQLTVPTTFVWGEASRFGSVATGKRLATLAEAVKWGGAIAQAGVLPHLELPAIVIGLLLKALKHHAV